MRCQLQLGDNVAEVTIAGKEIASELRIQAVKTFGIDIVLYNIECNGERVKDSFETAEEGQLFVITQKSSKIVDRIKALQEDTEAAFVQKKNIVQSGQIQGDVKQISQSSFKMLRKIAVDGLSVGREMQPESLQRLTDSFSTILEMFRLGNYKVSAETVSKAVQGVSTEISDKVRLPE